MVVIATTVDELVELPAGSVGLTGADNHLWRKNEDGSFDGGYAPKDILAVFGPMRVIWRPDKDMQDEARSAGVRDALTEARQVVSQYLATAELWRYNRVMWAFGIMLGEISQDTPEPGPDSDQDEEAPADCNCGWGGVHDPDNPRCRVNDPDERWLNPDPVPSEQAATTDEGDPEPGNRES